MASDTLPGTRQTVAPKHGQCPTAISHLNGPCATTGQSLTKWCGTRPHTTQEDAPLPASLAFFAFGAPPDRVGDGGRLDGVGAWDTRGALFGGAAVGAPLTRDGPATGCAAMLLGRPGTGKVWTTGRGTGISTLGLLANCGAGRRVESSTS